MIYIKKKIQEAITQIDKELEQIDFIYLKEQVDKFHKLTMLKDDLIELLHDSEEN